MVLKLFIFIFLSFLCRIFFVLHLRRVTVGEAKLILCVNHNFIERWYNFIGSNNIYS